MSSIGDYFLSNRARSEGRLSAPIVLLLGLLVLLAATFFLYYVPHYVLRYN